MTETEIGKRLGGWDQTTISTDVTALKEMSKQFIFDLAKSDLAFVYKKCLDRVDIVIKECFERYHNKSLNEKYRTAPLKLVLDATEIQFKLFSEGPQVLAAKTLVERLERIEQEAINRRPR